MTSYDFDALKTQIAYQLREHGKDASVADALGRHRVIVEVIGKWPPSTPLRATPADVHHAISAVSNAIDALARTPSNELTIRPLKTIHLRLHESVGRYLQNETPLPPGGPDEDAGGADEVVGRWPPE